MSVLIKGMEKPKSCTWWDGRCPLLGDDDDCKLQDCQEEWTWQDQYKGCPLSDAPDTNVDTISRQAAIDALTEAYEDTDAEWIINKLPSVQPRKRKWIFHETENDRYDDMICPFCKTCYTVDAYRIDDIGFTAEDFNFCPNCGADMRGEQDE